MLELGFREGLLDHPPGGVPINLVELVAELFEARGTTSPADEREARLRIQQVWGEVRAEQSVTEAAEMLELELRHFRHLVPYTRLMEEDIAPWVAELRERIWGDEDPPFDSLDDRDCREWMKVCVDARDAGQEPEPWPSDLPPGFLQSECRSIANGTGLETEEVARFVLTGENFEVPPIRAERWSIIQISSLEGGHTLMRDMFRLEFLMPGVPKSVLLEAWEQVEEAWEPQELPEDARLRRVVEEERKRSPRRFWGPVRDRMNEDAPEPKTSEAWMMQYRRLEGRA